jgi:outer membrane immunogenic protein
MTKLLLAFAAALLGGSANAADLGPVPVYAPPPVLVPLYTWTGCYIGANVGGIWTNNNWNDTVLGGLGSNTASGALGGLQTGCNYQLGSWVVGVAADYDSTKANSNNVNLLFPAGFAVTDLTQIKAVGSVAGRVGYAWDRILAYAKVGAAWMVGSYAFQAGGVSFATGDGRPDGWTMGIGGEYAFLNWLTAFIEYDYYHFNEVSPAALGCTLAACGLVANHVGITTKINVVKVGLNFKFGPSAGL